MATAAQVVKALQVAAEDLLGRKISQAELDSLTKIFDQTSGGPSDRMTKALAEFCQIAPDLLLEKRSASSNTNRLMIDLQSAITQWTAKK